MAGRTLITGSRVSASTILEVVVSMVIIVVVFGTAMMIFSNVTQMSLSVKKIKAQAVLTEALSKIEQRKDNVSPVVMTDDLTIENETKPYPADSLLVLVHLTAYDNNHQKVAELQKIIFHHHER